MGCALYIRCALSIEKYGRLISALKLCKVASNPRKIRDISGSLCGYFNVKNSGSNFVIYF